MVKTNITVVIVNYNTKDLLKKCLVSIFKWTREIEFRVIVVDNGSSDKSVELVKKEFGQVQVMENKKNLGFSKAYNQGIKEAKGEYILLLNSDTEFIENGLKKLCKWMESHPKVGIAGCQLLNADQSIQPSVGFFPRLLALLFWALFIDDLPMISRIIKPYQLRWLDFYKQKHSVDWLTGAFLFVRKEVFDRIGLLNEKIFMYGEDLEFCFRAKKADYKIMFVPISKLVHHGGDNIWKRKERAVIGEYEGLKFFFRNYKPKWEYPVLRLILKIGAISRWMLGKIINNHQLVKIYAKAYQLV